MQLWVLQVTIMRDGEAVSSAAIQYPGAPNAANQIHMAPGIALLNAYVLERLHDGWTWTDDLEEDLVTVSLRTLTFACANCGVNCSHFRQNGGAQLLKEAVQAWEQPLKPLNGSPNRQRSSKSQQFASRYIKLLAMFMGKRSLSHFIADLRSQPNFADASGIVAWLLDQSQVDLSGAELAGSPRTEAEPFAGEDLIVPSADIPFVCAPVAAGAGPGAAAEIKTQTLLPAPPQKVPAPVEATEASPALGAAEAAGAGSALEVVEDNQPQDTAEAQAGEADGGAEAPAHITGQEDAEDTSAQSPAKDLGIRQAEFWDQDHSSSTEASAEEE